MKSSKLMPLAVALAASLLVGCQKREQVPPTSEPPAGSTASAPTTGAPGTMGETPSTTPPAAMPPATSASPPADTAPAATPPASAASPTSSLEPRGGVAGTGTDGGLAGSGTVAGAGAMAQPGQDMAGAVSAGPLNTADKTFVAKVAGGGLYEVEVAKLAVDKASDPAVKSFATMLVDQHSAANAELKALAALRDVKLPDAVPADKKQVIAGLAKKSGASFDQAFVKQVGLKDHEENIKLFESASQDTKDAQLKAWVDKTLPALRSHLGAAQKLPGASS